MVSKIPNLINISAILLLSCLWGFDGYCNFVLFFIQNTCDYFFFLFDLLIFICKFFIVQASKYQFVELFVTNHIITNISFVILKNYFIKTKFILGRVYGPHQPVAF